MDSEEDEGDRIWVLRPMHFSSRRKAGSGIVPAEAPFVRRSAARENGMTVQVPRECLLCQRHATKTSKHGKRRTTSRATRGGEHSTLRDRGRYVRKDRVGARKDYPWTRQNAQATGD